MVVISSGSDMMCCKECTATQWASEAPHLWDKRSRWSTWPWPGFPPHSIQRWWHRSSYQCTSSRTALWTGRSASYLETPSPRWDRCRQNDPYSKKINNYRPVSSVQNQRVEDNSLTEGVALPSGCWCVWRQKGCWCLWPCGSCRSLRWRRSGTRPCTSWPGMMRSRWEYRGAPGGSANTHLEGNKEQNVTDFKDDHLTISN